MIAILFPIIPSTETPYCTDSADQQYIVTDLPKTRSGKIMRRVLRKIVSGEGDQLGDMSSLANPDSVDESELHLHVH